MKSFKFISFLFVAALYLTVISAGDSFPDEETDNEIKNPPESEIPKGTTVTPLPPLPPTPPENKPSEDMSSENELQDKDVKPAEGTSKIDTVESVKKAPCDVIIHLPKIVNYTSVETTKYTTRAYATVCVELETRYSTGYIWALAGVYDSEPTITSDMFPVDLSQLKDFSSDHIIVTRPLPRNEYDEKTEEKLKTESTYLPSPPAPVGRSGTAISKIRAVYLGVYYITYIFYRPFSVDEAPNTRIVMLTVE